MPQVITNVPPHYAQVWGRQTLRLTHGLAGDELFTDDALAALLDRVDPRLLGIKTMGEHCPDPSAWYQCSREGVSGADVLDAAKHGRLWINVSAVHEVDPAFNTVLDSIYRDLEAQIPGFRTSKRRLGLLISSPNAHVVYHADPLGQGLVQIRGNKRVWIYPASAPFLQPNEIEDIVRGVREEDLSYDPWFDQFAEVHELGPGELMTWELNAPHRVRNHDSLNVSLTTEHWTDDVRNAYLMNYANGLIRSRGLTPRSRAVRGAAFWAKAGLTAAERIRRGRSAAAATTPAFRVDPTTVSGTSPYQSIQ